ncbi:hypothetical protein [Microvirga sp. P5_D2]
MPAVTDKEAEVVLGQTSSSWKADRLSGSSEAAPATSPSPRNLEDLGISVDMNASVDTLADQMLTLVEIVSAQEKDIKSLKEHCRKLDEHNQAIMVGFSAFFHVLAVGRVAKASEIASLLQNISKIAEQEGRPKESVKFLQDLARMVPGHSDNEQEK